MAHIALHPSTRILLGLSLIVLSSALGGFALIVSIVILVSWLYQCRDSVALRWVRRARYLLIVPPILSGYVIPGTGILPLDVWVPTWEGLTVGATQSLRLLFALLALRACLRGLSAKQLMQGLVTLLAPLRHFGLKVEQAARRLSLTMAYMNQLDGRKARDLLVGIQQTRPPL